MCDKTLCESNLSMTGFVFSSNYRGIIVYHYQENMAVFKEEMVSGHIASIFKRQSEKDVGLDYNI